MNKFTIHSCHNYCKLIIVLAIKLQIVLQVINLIFNFITQIIVSTETVNPSRVSSIFINASVICLWYMCCYYLRGSCIKSHFN